MVYLILIYAILATWFWEPFKAVTAWKMFQKLGLKGWKAFIPFYNLYIEYRFTWESNWSIAAWGGAIAGYLLQMYTKGTFSMLGTALFLTGTVVKVRGNFKLSEAFGKDRLYGLGLWLLTPVFVLMLGLGSSKYQKKRK